MELSNILELIHAVSDSNLTQFQMQDGNLNISMSTEKTILQQTAVNADIAAFETQHQPAGEKTACLTGQVMSRPFKEPSAHQENPADSSQSIASGNIVKSPLVGTYYAASSPDSEPFVKVGDQVSKGQVLGIVEAMKLMNEIESDFDCEIEAVLVSNEQRVEYGQPLFKVKKLDD